MLVLLEKLPSNYNTVTK